MKTRINIVLIALSMAVAMALGAATTAYSKGEKGFEVGEAVVITAEVLAIDKEDRILTLLGPKENVVDVVLGEGARNFDPIKVWDAIHARLTKAIAISAETP